jgi:transcriptional regulator with XRE-family HTH domain
MRWRSSPATSAGSFTVAVISAQMSSRPWNSTFPESKNHPTLPICDFELQIDRKALTESLLQRKNLLKKPTSLGKHLRNRRLLAAQTQRQAAAQIGVLREVYDRWERDETEPTVGFWKRIITLLGYYPMPPDGGSADLVLMARRVQGFSQYALGRKLGVIAKIVRAWENGLADPDPARLKRLRALAGGIPTS